jgi:hypothetical protein
LDYVDDQTETEASAAHSFGGGGDGCSSRIAGQQKDPFLNLLQT